MNQQTTATIQPQDCVASFLVSAAVLSCFSCVLAMVGLTAATYVLFCSLTWHRNIHRHKTTGIHVDRSASAHAHTVSRGRQKHMHENASGVSVSFELTTQCLSKFWYVSALQRTIVGHTHAASSVLRFTLGSKVAAILRSPAPEPWRSSLYTAAGLVEPVALSNLPGARIYFAGNLQCFARFIASVMRIYCYSDLAGTRLARDANVRFQLTLASPSTDVPRLDSV